MKEYWLLWQQQEATVVLYFANMQTHFCYFSNCILYLLLSIQGWQKMLLASFEKFSADSVCLARTRAIQQTNLRSQSRLIISVA